MYVVHTISTTYRVTKIKNGGNIILVAIPIRTWIIFSADPRRKLTALAIFLLKSKAKILLGYQSTTYLKAHDLRNRYIGE